LGSTPTGTGKTSSPTYSQISKAEEVMYSLWSIPKTKHILYGYTFSQHNIIWTGLWYYHMNMFGLDLHHVGLLCTSSPTFSQISKADEVLYSLWSIPRTKTILYGWTFSQHDIIWTGLWYYHMKMFGMDVHWSRRPILHELISLLSYL